MNDLLGKSTAIDGLFIEFYKTVWSLIKTDFHKMFGEVYKERNCNQVCFRKGKQ